MSGGPETKQSIHKDGGNVDQPIRPPHWIQPGHSWVQSADRLFEASANKPPQIVIQVVASPSLPDEVAPKVLCVPGGQRNNRKTVGLEAIPQPCDILVVLHT